MRGLLTLVPGCHGKWTLGGKSKLSRKEKEVVEKIKGSCREKKSKLSRKEKYVVEKRKVSCQEKKISCQKRKLS